MPVETKIKEFEAKSTEEKKRILDEEYTLSGHDLRKIMNGGLFIAIKAEITELKNRVKILEE